MTDRRRCSAALDDIRRTGVAYDHEEYVMGVCAVATPVHDAVGAVGALTVEIAAVTLQEQGREEHVVKAPAPSPRPRAPGAARVSPPRGLGRPADGSLGAAPRGVPRGPRLDPGVISRESIGVLD